MFRHASVLFLFLLLLGGSTWIATATARGGSDITLISVATDGTQGNDNADAVVLSGDGAFAVIQSNATTLTDDDFNFSCRAFAARSCPDLYLRDNRTHETSKLTHAIAPQAADSPDTTLAVDDSGDVIAFATFGENLEAELPAECGTMGCANVYVYDRAADTLERVSRRPDGSMLRGGINYMAMSSDSRFVVYSSTDGEIVPNDTNFGEDIFLVDRGSGTTDHISVAMNGGVGNGIALVPDVSDDGRYVVFLSTSDDLVPNDTNDRPDIFLRDRQNNTTTLISRTSTGGEAPTGANRPRISDDGSVITFETGDALIPEDTDGAGDDVYLYERVSGQLELISIGNEEEIGEYTGGGGVPSANGQQIVFYSNSANLVPGDTNNAVDIFVRDRSAGTTLRVSVDSNGLQGNDHSVHASISDDGQVVSFDSMATNLVPGDTNGYTDIFRHDIPSGQTIRVSLNQEDVQANHNSATNMVSGNGRVVAFLSQARLVPGLPDNFYLRSYVRDIDTNETVLVSRTPGLQANHGSGGADMTPDGRWVAFYSVASNLVLSDTNNRVDSFVLDRTTGTIELVSNAPDGSPANDNTSEIAISDDGSWVAFLSYATNLVTDTVATNLSRVYLLERATGEITLVSRRSDGSVSDAYSGSPTISGDGVWVAFNTGDALIPTDSNNRGDIYLWNRLTGTISLVSVSSSGTLGNGSSQFPSLSEDGRYIAFTSSASTLVLNDTNNRADIFVHDRQTGSTERVSISSAGTQANGEAYSAQISADGRYVSFSTAQALALNDTNNTSDVYVRDRQLGLTTVVSLGTNGNAGNNASGGPAISADGTRLGFLSYADNVVSGDTNAKQDAFMMTVADAPPLPTVTPSLTPSPSSTATATGTPLPTRTPTITRTPTQTATPSATGTLSPTATRTPSPSATLIATHTPTPLATTTVLPTASTTHTPIAIPTGTVMGTLTATPMNPSATATGTVTTIPTIPSSSTPMSITPTATRTPLNGGRQLFLPLAQRS